MEENSMRHIAYLIHPLSASMSKGSGPAFGLAGTILYAIIAFGPSSASYARVWRMEKPEGTFSDTVWW